MRSIRSFTATWDEVKKVWKLSFLYLDRHNGMYSSDSNEFKDLMSLTSFVITFH